MDTSAVFPSLWNDQISFHLFNGKSTTTVTDTKVVYRMNYKNKNIIIRIIRIILDSAVLAQRIDRNTRLQGYKVTRNNLVDNVTQTKVRN